MMSWIFGGILVIAILIWLTYATRHAPLYGPGEQPIAEERDRLAAEIAALRRQLGEVHAANALLRSAVLDAHGGITRLADDVDADIDAAITIVTEQRGRRT